MPGSTTDLLFPPVPVALTSELSVTTEAAPEASFMRRFRVVLAAEEPPGRWGTGGLPFPRFFAVGALGTAAFSSFFSSTPRGQPSFALTGWLVGGVASTVRRATRSEDTAALWWRAGVMSTSPPIAPDARHTRMEPFSKPTNLHVRFKAEVQRESHCRPNLQQVTHAALVTLSRTRATFARHWVLLSPM